MLVTDRFMHPTALFSMHTCALLARMCYLQPAAAQKLRSNHIYELFRIFVHIYFERYRNSEHYVI